ncbi:hypothetical protein [Streptomyces sp. NPDC101178]|uniref:hypothetical protein n=1 Tax=Streptomyces sp. NPDC101178 TaxID=3366124 RepID=UPI0037FCAD4A
MGNSTSTAQPHGNIKSSRLVAGAVFTALAVLPLSMATAPPAEAASKRVCAPSGKCVTTKKYCPPGSKCGKKVFREVPKTQYCSSSVGCFTYKGKNYRYIAGPSLTSKQQQQVWKCASSLGVTGLGAAVATGPVGVTILGVAVSLWGCT